MRALVEAGVHVARTLDKLPVLVQRWLSKTGGQFDATGRW